MKYLILLLLFSCSFSSETNIKKPEGLVVFIKETSRETYYKICNNRLFCYCKQDNTSHQISVPCEFFDTLE